MIVPRRRDPVVVGVVVDLRAIGDPHASGPHRLREFGRSLLQQRKPLRLIEGVVGGAVPAGEQLEFPVCGVVGGGHVLHCVCAQPASAADSVSWMVDCAVGLGRRRLTGLEEQQVRMDGAEEDWVRTADILGLLGITVADDYLAVDQAERSRRGFLLSEEDLADGRPGSVGADQEAA